MNKTSHLQVDRRAQGRRWRARGVALFLVWGATLAVDAQTLLADKPLFSATDAPGNLALSLSVEFPTAVSVAHINRTYTPSGADYLGYFDPNKCYGYRYSSSDTTTTPATPPALPDSYFYPAGAATSHVCSGKWSGNFLNWATMQTIDPFRWVLTGGYRVVDTTALTVIEKAYASGQGGTNNFPDSSIDATTIAGATPFGPIASGMNMRIQGLGNKLRFSLGTDISLSANYYNNMTLSGTPVLTRTDLGTSFITGGVSPGPGVNVNGYSVRWTGTLTAPTSGTYSFQTVSDDGVRLYIDHTPTKSNLVVNNFTNHGSTTDTAVAPSGAPNALVFNAGDTIYVTLEYYQNTGGAVIRLTWQPPGQSGYTAFNSGAADLNSNAVTPQPFTGTGTQGGVSYEVFARAKVCDSSLTAGGLETNCTQYGTNWKPEGLIQKYANTIRYSAFGYLNDGDIARDGGVLRARQKFVGPTQPVHGAPAVVNQPGVVTYKADGSAFTQTTGAEWDGATGIFIGNPDAQDVTDTNTAFGTSVGNSGVINYLNKFGEASGSYKTYDPVSELYYASIRYFKNLGNVPEWTSMSGASAAVKAGYADGFPVITSWDDPILYSCQRNFVLGIGDEHTHADKDVAGYVHSTGDQEPGTPPLVSSDTTVNAVTATNLLGTAEGLGNSVGSTYPWGSCCNHNSALIAGLAYDSHIKDIRPGDFRPSDGSAKPTISTVDTYWVDVLESPGYQNNNQYYLATKYGGFTVPAGYAAGTAITPVSAWHTNSDTLGSNPRPDNYYPGNRPDLVQSGLVNAFNNIASAIKRTPATTALASSLPQISTANNLNYSSSYSVATWTSDVTASTLSFDASGNPTQSTTPAWSFATQLAAQIAANGGGGWSNNRQIATWNTSTNAAVPFSISSLSSTQQTQLVTGYTSGNDASNYLNYLRGDSTNEQGSTASGSTHAYRTRASPLGDVVGSKSRPVGPPAFPFSDAANPGYSAFKTAQSARPTVVYVGANDGMLHAINGSATTAAGGGTEMFAYVPGALYAGPSSPSLPTTNGLASLGNPSFTHHYMVNASPNEYDVDFARVPSASGAVQTGVADWHSVLVSGLGKGGRSYFAIDVTDPVSMNTDTKVANKVLWEFTHTKLGYTFGDAMIVKVKKYGWVAIFTSGYDNADGVGYFFIVNPKTGALLEPPISTGVGSVINDAGLAQSNAFVVDSTDGTADSVYAGDLLGNVWRLDLTALPGSGAYAAPLKIASLADSGGVAQPVTARPVVEVNPRTKKRFVMVGTGRLLDTTDVLSVQQQSFYAIVDGTNARFNASTDLPAGINFPITRSNLISGVNGTTFDPASKIGWYIDLGNAATGARAGYRVLLDATTLAGTVAFAATLPGGDVCNPSGTTNFYALDYGSTVSAFKNTDGTSLLYVTKNGTGTDLRFTSVSGTAELLYGIDLPGIGALAISPLQPQSVRRLNWRELQTVE